MPGSGEGRPPPEPGVGSCEAREEASISDGGKREAALRTLANIA